MARFCIETDGGPIILLSKAMKDDWGGDERATYTNGGSPSDYISACKQISNGSEIIKGRNSSCLGFFSETTSFDILLEDNMVRICPAIFVDVDHDLMDLTLGEDIYKCGEEKVSDLSPQMFPAFLFDAIETGCEKTGENSVAICQNFDFQPALYRRSIDLGNLGFVFWEIRAAKCLRI